MRSEQLAWLIRRHGVEMTHVSGGSHIGSVLSVADVVAVLYADVMRYRADDPAWEGRDRLVLGKGHAGAALYAALAEEGFFPTAELLTHYQDGGRLSGHVSHHVPGAEFSTGSLGHGLSVAVGMAYALRKAGRAARVFAVLGDGECDEGAVWEAALFAAHWRLSNLTCVVDRNHMQSLDFGENTLELGDLTGKWRAFGWNAAEVDGHDHAALRAALGAGPSGMPEPDRPLAVVASTVKGYGVPFMQNDVLWHYRFPHDGWEYEGAVAALHASMPDGVADPYTPQGFPAPAAPPADALEGGDHSLTLTWAPAYPAVVRRVEAPAGTAERPRRRREGER